MIRYDANTVKSGTKSTQVPGHWPSGVIGATLDHPALLARGVLLENPVRRNAALLLSNNLGPTDPLAIM